MLRTKARTKSRRLKWSYARLVLITFDVIALLAALQVAYFARYTLGWTFTGEGSAIDPLIPPLCLAVTLATFWFLDLYSMRLVGSGLDEYRAVARNTTFAFAGIVVISYIDQSLRVSRMFLLLFWLSTIVLVVLGRFVARQVIRAWSRSRGGLRRVVVAGANNQAIQLARELDSNRAACSTVLGFLSDYRPVGQLVDRGLRILGEPTQLHEIGRRFEATHAIVVQSALSWESLRFIVRSMHSDPEIELLLAPGLFDVAATPLQFTQVGAASLLVPSASRIVGIEAILKRSLDIVLASIVLVITLPIRAAIWGSLRLRGTRRPIQTIEATGFGGTPIRLRRFSAGRWLRASHLARLPSLWSVLSGEMSLVGPRPMIAGESSGYEAWSDVLSSLRPGFIGPWWVSGRGRPAGLQDEIEADLHYVRSYTIWLDLRILVAVAWTLLSSTLRPATASVPDQPLPSVLAHVVDDD